MTRYAKRQIIMSADLERKLEARRQDRLRRSAAGLKGYATHTHKRMLRDVLIGARG